MRRAAPLLLCLSIAGCATPRLHSEQELALTATRCALSPGDLVQEDELRKVLMWMTDRPTVGQHRCVKDWARRQHLHLAIVTIDRTNR
jgi:hypothetical protein